eukprot:TRINITY_DN14874_c0_g1_i3.p1 TRINITY_DN14874_c0_g1~~TRINITY_DN14874_c0_g1_i3.p1  ORF type:complete len:1163 (-),score=247.48 TRINITY_DN14874_c0_g1_i3:114-3602(-)
MVRPWLDAKEDPDDLTPAEVTFTATIDARCRSDYSRFVKCDFLWFAEDGGLSQPVATGSFAEGTWEKVGEPEEFAVSGEENPVGQVANDKVEDSAAEGGEKQVPIYLEGFRFQKESPTWRGSCTMARQLAVSAVRVKVTYPDPSEPPPGARTSSPPPADPPGKGKAPPPQEPMIKEVTTEVVVPLAPLLVQKIKGTAGPCVWEDFLASVPCQGLKAFKVSVRCSGPTLSEEIVSHLNPLLLTLGGVHRLPKEAHLGQRQDVYTVLEAFGDRHATTNAVLAARGTARHQAHLVYFLGTWPQHETRELLQEGRLLVEVHDRDKAARTTGDGEEARTPGWENSVDEVAASETPYGQAVFSLAELLNPRLNQPLVMRVNLEPRISKKMQQRGMGGSKNLKVASLIKGDAESRELLASMETASYAFMPDFLTTGACVSLTATLARPLQSPASPEAEVPADVTEEPAKTTRYERFARMVLVVDYRRTTVVKKLLGVVNANNVEVLNLDSGQARALATIKLTEEQRSDASLDIITGFIVMDRHCRIIVVECLREGKALEKLLEVVPSVQTAKLKVLCNHQLGFSQRLYTDFNLVLKQVKLRQARLEGLIQRPDLCLPGRSEDDVSRGLNQLAEMKRAERIHVLKLMGSFPMAQSIVNIETQYGDFVADKELQGGCLGDDGKSVHSKMTGRTGRSKGTATSGTVSSKQAAQVAAVAEQDDGGSDSDGESVVEEVKVRNAKIYLKEPLDTTNEAYTRRLMDRSIRPPPDLVGLNKTAVDELSRMVQEASGPKKVGPRKNVDTSFLAPDAPVHIYSGQALNTADLQKKALRAKMDGQEGKKLWTYSEERNSGCFPMLDKEVPLDRMLRQEVKLDDGRTPWLYPRPRKAQEDYKHPNDVSEARKEDLRSRWAENEWHQELEKKEVVRGAFDAQALGTGGAHVIPLRRPANFDSGGIVGYEDPDRHEEFEPMKFQARASVNLEAVQDKFHRTLLDGDPKALGICFDERNPPKHIRKKYGVSRKGNDTLKAPPASYQGKEEYLEDKANYDFLSDYMRSISRPVVNNPHKLHKEAQKEGHVNTEWNSSQHLNSLNGKSGLLKNATSKAWKDATLAATGKPWKNSTLRSSNDSKGIKPAILLSARDPARMSSAISFARQTSNASATATYQAQPLSAR